MSVVITWAVNQMDCYPEYEGQTDVVFTVHWTLTGTDGEYTSSGYGTQSVSFDEGADFTPFDELTEEQVIGWVQDAMGEERVAALEASITAELEAQANPPVVTPALPWG